MSETDQSVVFVGLGYIGLPTAVTLANSGVRVKGVDVNESVVERVARGEVTIVEPGLEEELKRAVDSGQLTALGSMACSMPSTIDGLPARMSRRRPTKPRHSESLWGAARASVGSVEWARNSEAPPSSAHRMCAGRAPRAVHILLTGEVIVERPLRRRSRTSAHE